MPDFPSRVSAAEGAILATGDGRGDHQLRINGDVTGESGDGQQVTEDAILACFERHSGEGPGDPRPFRLPFGRGSRRWAPSEALEGE